MPLQLMLILRRRRHWCQSWRFSLTLETMWTSLTCWGPALSEVRGAAQPSTPNLVHPLEDLQEIAFAHDCYICVDWFYFFTVIGIVCRGCVESADICWWTELLLCPINTGLLLKIRYWAVNADQHENVMQFDWSQIYCAVDQYSFPV